MNNQPELIEAMKASLILTLCIAAVIGTITLVVLLKARRRRRKQAKCNWHLNKADGTSTGYHDPSPCRHIDLGDGNIDDYTPTYERERSFFGSFGGGGDSGGSYDSGGSSGSSFGGSD